MDQSQVENFGRMWNFLVSMRNMLHGNLMDSNERAEYRFNQQNESIEEMQVELNGLLAYMIDISRNLDVVEHQDHAYPMEGLSSAL